MGGGLGTYKTLVILLWFELLFWKFGHVYSLVSQLSIEYHQKIHSATVEEGKIMFLAKSTCVLLKLLTFDSYFSADLSNQKTCFINGTTLRQILHTLFKNFLKFGILQHVLVSIHINSRTHLWMLFPWIRLSFICTASVVHLACLLLLWTIRYIKISLGIYLTADPSVPTITHQIYKGRQKEFCLN